MIHIIDETKHYSAFMMIKITLKGSKELHFYNLCTNYDKPTWNLIFFDR